MTGVPTASDISQSGKTKGTYQRFVGLKALKCLIEFIFEEDPEE